METQESKEPAISLDRIKEIAVGSNDGTMIETMALAQTVLRLMALDPDPVDHTLTSLRKICVALGLNPVNSARWGDHTVDLVKSLLTHSSDLAVDMREAATVEGRSALLDNLLSNLFPALLDHIVNSLPPRQPPAEQPPAARPAPDVVVPLKREDPSPETPPMA